MWRSRAVFKPKTLKNISNTGKILLEKRKKDLKS